MYMTYRSFTAVESLEARRLLAGVTILTHGYNGDTTGWVDTAAKDIQARLAGSQSSSSEDDPTIAHLNVTAGSDGLVVAYDGLSNTPLVNTTQAELIIELDWSTVSTGNYTTTQVASAVANYLFTPPISEATQILQLPLHLIGHSRGASLNAALSRFLGQRGVEVDQNTFLDPHPVDGSNDFLGANFGDEKMAVYDNVTFSDDYWRTDGNANNADFDGEAVAGSFNGSLAATVQQQFIQSAHAAVTAYYVGTIDLDTVDGGDHPIFPSWYGTTAAAPPRDATGFAFSREIGVSRPKTGLAQVLGGMGSRVATSHTGTQYSNVADVKIAAGSLANSNGTIKLQARYSDRDSTASVTWFVDNDRNPFQSISAVLATKSVAASSNAIVTANALVGSVPAGTFYVGAKILDADGHARYWYNDTPVTFPGPNFAAITDRVLRATGTAGNDVIRVVANSVDPSANAFTTVELNGVTMRNFRSADFDRIEILAGDGRDTVTLPAVNRPAYVDGGAGADNVTGGVLNDTLTGGGGQNTLVGGDGDDRLNGSGGNDALAGGSGNDRLYGNGGTDTYNGGGNVDRIFGSAGNDYMVGGNGNDKLYGYGGNDTLIGQVGIDLLDGGAGTDSADNDPDDLRTDIEILLA